MRYIRKFNEQADFRPPYNSITKPNIFYGYKDCVDKLLGGWIAHDGKISMEDYLKQCEKYKINSSEEESKYISDAILYLRKIIPIKYSK